MIDVTTTKSATFHVYRLGNPDRLVLDVEGMRNAVRLKLIPPSSSLVKDVRVGQFREKDPEVVRVVGAGLRGTSNAKPQPPYSGSAGCQPNASLSCRPRR